MAAATPSSIQRIANVMPGSSNGLIRRRRRGIIHHPSVITVGLLECPRGIHVTHIGTNWYTEFFNEDYVKIYSERLSQDGDGA